MRPYCQVGKLLSIDSCGITKICDSNLKQAEFLLNSQQAEFIMTNYLQLSYSLSGKQAVGNRLPRQGQANPQSCPESSCLFILLVSSPWSLIDYTQDQKFSLRSLTLLRVSLSFFFFFSSSACSLGRKDTETKP